MLRPNPSSKQPLELPHPRPQGKLSRAQHFQHSQLLSLSQYRLSEGNQVGDVSVIRAIFELS
jgi:hypothetical protein